MPNNQDYKGNNSNEDVKDKLNINNSNDDGNNKTSYDYFRAMGFFRE